MMRRNLVLSVMVLLLLVVPFWLTSLHDADHERGESFAGTDEQATRMISRLAPEYRPWAASLFQPPSGEVECLLFALQAALGASVLGYWLGSAVTRRRYERQSPPAC